MGNPGLQWASWLHEPDRDALRLRLRALRANVYVMCTVESEAFESEHVPGSTARKAKHALLVQLCDELMQLGEFDQ